MSTVHIELPDEVLKLVGSSEKIKQEATEAFVFNLVRKGMISRSKAAEILGINLWDLPERLAQYEIPWFQYQEADVAQDSDLLKNRKREGK